MEEIRFVIIGLGHIGKRHFDLIEAHPHAKVVACIDTDSSKAPLGCPFFDSFQAYATSSLEADVLSVCTPNGLHATHSLEGIANNLHVLCEKPMGLSKETCEKVLFQALQNNKRLFLVMQNRYSPPSVWLKSIIEAEKLGEIYKVQVNCYWNRGDEYYSKSNWKGTLELDGGPLYTQFSHFIDLMYWLFGDIKHIMARFDNFKHQHNTAFEDAGLVSFDFERGGMGTINYTTAVNEQNFESSITVIGEKGTVKVGGQYMDEVVYCSIEDYTMPHLQPSQPPNDYGSYKGSAANHQFVIQNVIDTLKGKSTITTNAMEGLKVVDIIERIYAYR